MEKTERECCWWRNAVESAIEKGDKSILEQCIWNWIRYGVYQNPAESHFSCSICQKRAIELGEICGVDLADKNIMFETVQTKIRNGMIKCCEVVSLIDLEDPDKFILREQAVGFKFQFQEKLCFVCSVKINGILTTLESSYPKN